jgi:ketosteroid isomerase-like protein
MSEKNLEIVRAAMDAYMSEDHATFRKLAAPDIVVSGRPDQPDADDFHGYDGLLRMAAEWLEAWDEPTIEVARVWDAGDFVFVGTRESGRGKISGIPTEHESTFVYTLKDCRIVRIQIFGSEREALEAVGLPSGS